jgi:hypothetical protein
MVFSVPQPTVSASARAVAPTANAPLATPTTGSPLLDRLIAQGRAIPAANPGPIPPAPPRDDSEETVSLSATLAEMRSEERY